jgi:hypothetical protein
MRYALEARRDYQEPGARSQEEEEVQWYYWLVIGAANGLF